MDKWLESSVTPVLTTDPLALLNYDYSRCWKAFAMQTEKENAKLLIHLSFCFVFLYWNYQHPGHRASSFSVMSVPPPQLMPFPEGAGLSQALDLSRTHPTHAVQVLQADHIPSISNVLIIK